MTRNEALADARMYDRRKPAPEWLLEQCAVRRDLADHARRNRAAINAAWEAEWDGRIEPLTPAEKRQADAEWSAL